MATSPGGFVYNDTLDLNVLVPTYYFISLGDEFGGGHEMWNSSYGTVTNTINLANLNPHDSPNTNQISNINLAESGSLGRLDVAFQDDTQVFQMTLRYNCVPEPSAIILLGLGTVMCGRKKKGRVSIPEN